ncbi:D-alanyl-D-alanine carboxypeptidase family protein [Sorangium sp. So ce367]|uniref:D-alanyl-D-alanine carboxypeptidase family protein n=1 Tax=Sorangium sp. So ce367 TaxID=3133305 RepID=UPI003F6002FD
MREQRRYPERPSDPYPAVTGSSRDPGYRSFDGQRDIWEKKYDLVLGRPFDRITQEAVDACSDIARLTLHAQWDQGDEDHRRCWAHLRGRHPALIEHQILQASSAPGTSRHHWGTDFDMFSLTMSEWHQPPLSEAHGWLEENASIYGFSQPYCAPTEHGRVFSWGYMEEAWHWSFYPIAEALMEFASAHRDELEDRLVGLWDERDRQRSREGKPSAYRFIRSHWSSYIFNVSRDLR